VVRTSITYFDKNWTPVFEESAMFGNTCVFERTFSSMKQRKSKSRNQMADETPDHSLRLANANNNIDIGPILSEKPRPQVSH